MSRMMAIFKVNITVCIIPLTLASLFQCYFFPSNFYVMLVELVCAPYGESFWTGCWSLEFWLIWFYFFAGHLYVSLVVQVSKQKQIYWIISQLTLVKRNTSVNCVDSSLHIRQVSHYIIDGTLVRVNSSDV